MRLLKQIAFFCFLLISVQGLSQVNHTVTADHHENIYKIDGTVLRKIQANSSEVFHYDVPSGNFITSIDVSNPMCVLVFSKAFNTILFLDNQLSPLRDAFQLEDKGYFNVPVACYASRGGFWIYDGDEKKIKHFNTDENLDVESGQIPNVKTDPIFIKEVNNKIYLGFAEAGILIFNTYGAYINTLPLKHDKVPVITDKCIIYSKHNEIFYYDFLNLESQLIFTCSNHLNEYYKTRNVLVVLCGENETVLNLP